MFDGSVATRSGGVNPPRPPFQPRGVQSIPGNSGHNAGHSRRDSSPDGMTTQHPARRMLTTGSAVWFGQMRGGVAPPGQSTHSRASDDDERRGALGRGALGSPSGANGTLDGGYLGTALSTSQKSPVACAPPERRYGVGHSG